mgnify:CR=1 FL=1
MPKGIYIRSKEHGTHVWEARRRNRTDHWEVKDTTNIKNQKNRYKFPKGNVPWNVNLTKDDERVAACIEKGRETQKRKHASGELKIWCEDLTKETDERVASIGRKNSENMIKLWKDDEYRKEATERASKTCYFKILNKENAGKTYKEIKYSHIRDIQNKNYINKDFTLNDRRLLDALLSFLALRWEKIS